MIKLCLMILFLFMLFVTMVALFIGIAIAINNKISRAIEEHSYCIKFMKENDSQIFFTLKKGEKSPDMNKISLWTAKKGKGFFKEKEQLPFSIIRKPTNQDSFSDLSSEQGEQIQLSIPIMKNQDSPCLYLYESLRIKETGCPIFFRLKSVEYWEQISKIYEDYLPKNFDYRRQYLHTYLCDQYNEIKEKMEKKDPFVLTLGMIKLKHKIAFSTTRFIYIMLGILIICLFAIKGTENWLSSLANDTKLWIAFPFSVIFLLFLGLQFSERNKKERLQRLILDSNDLYIYELLRSTLSEKTGLSEEAVDNLIDSIAKEPESYMSSFLDRF